MMLAIGFVVWINQKFSHWSGFVPAGGTIKMKKILLFFIVLSLSNPLSAGILLKRRLKDHANPVINQKVPEKKNSRALLIGITAIGYGSIMFSSANKLESKKKEGANTGRMVGVLSYLASAWCLYSYFYSSSSISMSSSPSKTTLAFTKKF